MGTIEDVREALWSAYTIASSHPDYYGKRSEGAVEIFYRPFHDCVSKESFFVPSGIMVYSYALGPSRSHYFMFGDKEDHPNYYTWVSIDPYTKAVETINEWLDSFINDGGSDEDY